MSTTKILRKTPPAALPSDGSKARPEPTPSRRPQIGRTAPSRSGPEAVPRLNGCFLQGYDHGSKAVEPERGVTERFCQERRLRDRAQKRVLQAHRNPVKTEPEIDALASALEIILDDSNLLPFDFLRTGDRLGRAVVKIQRRDGAAGTGFLVAPGILLTNHHVLPDAATASESTASANFETNPPDDPAGRPVVVPLRPCDLFVANEDLDFAFCGVRGLDHLGAIPLNRNSLGIMRSEFVNIIQHPGGRPKEVALQDSQVVKVDNVVVQYSCDTEPGSSGSPVFTNRWNLVALHHASVESDAASGGRRSPGADPRLRFLNEGIRLSAIALWLESAEAHAAEIRDQTARLRSLFEGL
ncbi:MAG TPA: serine protease, partial [Isosphaeraceae bacterium]|nr:serine protease [Isosphaeraceae bacterium]